MKSLAKPFYLNRGSEARIILASLLHAFQNIVGLYSILGELTYLTRANSLKRKKIVWFYQF